jgi:oligopeptide transport system substrate-binding protein
MTKLSKILLVMILSLTTVFVSCSKSTDTTSAAKGESQSAVGTDPVEKEAPAVDEQAEVTKAVSNMVALADVENFVIPTEDEVQRGGAFVISNGTEPESLDPHLIQGEPEHRLNYAFFEGLVENDPKSSNAIPGLAKSWEVSDDATVITFHLRKSNWSDGTPLTTKDVVYSWKRELDPATASPYAWFPEMFLKGAAEYAKGEISADELGFKALDDYTLQVTLVGPLPYAVPAFAHYSFGIVPEHCIEEYGDQWTHPGSMVSNGPFLLSEHVAQSYVEGVRNENYWDADNVYLDSVRFLASDDSNTNYNMYIAGDLDWLPAISTEQMDSAQMSNDFQSGPQLATAYYVIQCNDSVLNNTLVRQALSYAVDRDSMVDNVTKGNQIPAWGMVPPMSGYDALEFPFDSYVEACEIAQGKMTEAGYPNGIGFPKITLLYNSNESNKKVAELLQANYKSVLGIDCTLENQEWGTFLQNRNQGSFQLARSGWVGDYQDPNTFLDQFLTGAAMNGGHFENSKYDSLIRKASTMPAGPARFEVLNEAENILVNENQATIPFYFYSSGNLVDTEKWGGWYTNTMNYHPLKSIYLKK